MTLPIVEVAQTQVPAGVQVWRVLNVNDDEGARRYKSTLLRAAGFEVVEAARGAEAVEMAATHAPDLILLDVQLPDDNGVEICRRLQPPAMPDVFEGDRPFAIVLISAHVTQPDDIARGMAAGADAYLVEPLDDAFLIGTVRAVVQRHAQRRAAAAERADLRARDYRYRVLSATVGDVIYEWDFASDRVEWSDAVYRVLEYEPGAVGARSRWWVDRVHADDRERVLGALGRALARKRITLEREYRFQRGDGSYATVVDRSTILYDDGDERTPLRAIGVMTDVTERRRLADQLRLSQKLEAVGLLAGGIAHDFNNVLTTVVGFTDLVRADPQVTPGIAEHLDDIDEAARRGSALIARLLAFSREQVLEPEVLDINDVIVASARMLNRLIGPRQVIEQRLTPGLPPIRVDRTQLEQVLLNLVVNARDAMPDGGVVTIATTLVTEPAHDDGVVSGPCVELLVSDTGTGIDEQTRSRIFEPFFTTKERGRGTGLGLSTVYGIVRQSGGVISVDSAPGEGCAFRILLPVEAAVQADWEALC